MKDDNCIFCKLANGDIPTNSIYEDEDFNVILDMGPATKGHALILPKEHYKNLYRVLYEYTSFKFMINLLEDKDKQLVLYVYPYTKETPKKIRVVSDKFSVDRLTTYQLTNLTKGDILVNRLLAERKICFSDNLTGTEFFQIKKERGFF